MTADRRWRLAKALWGVAVVVFVAVYIGKKADGLATAFAAVPPWAIAASAVGILLGKLLLAANVQHALRKVDESWPFTRCLDVYNITQFGKYIPGSIWQFVGRAGVYARAGMRPAAITTTMVIESGWVVVSAMVLGLLALAATIDPARARALWEAYGLIMAAAVLFAGVVAFIAARKLLPRLEATRGPLVDTRALLILTGIWCCLGAAFALTLSPEQPELHTFVFAMGLYALAYAVGFLTPFAPAGLGVREGILVVGLAPWLGTELAVVASLMNRVLYLGVEVLLVGVPWLWSRRPGAKEPHPRD